MIRLSNCFRSTYYIKFFFFVNGTEHCRAGFAMVAMQQRCRPLYGANRALKASIFVKVGQNDLE